MFVLLFCTLFLSFSNFVVGFGPVATSVRLMKKTQVNMVIYWSIKSAIDLAGYSLGVTPTFQGTGVWSGIKLSRDETSNESEDKKSSNTEVNKINTSDAKMLSDKSNVKPK